MKTNRFDNSVASVGLLLFATLFADPSASAQDVAAFSVFKSQHFIQTSDAAPALRTTNPFLFEALVEGTGGGEIFGVDLTKPGSLAATPLSGDGLIFQLGFGFSSLSALNAAFGSGSYRFVFDTENDLITIANLDLPADNYPATPRVSNFPAAQSVNPATDFTVRWDRLTGGTTDDLVELAIYDSQDNQLFSDSGLDGTSTSEVVPSTTLMAGQTYRVELKIWKIVGFNATDYPNALGFSAFYKTTEFSLKTTSQGGNPPTLSNPIRQSNGSFQLRVAGDAGLMYRIEATTDFTSWNAVLTTNAPAGGSFDVVDPQTAGLSSRFYRAILVP